MSVVSLRFHDRWGNNCFQYCSARAYARKVGATLQTTPWIGQQVFEIDDPPIDRELPARYDMDLEQWDGETDIDLTGWGMHQKCLLYSRADAKAWFKFKPWVSAALAQVPKLEIAAHIRHADFITEAKFIAVSIPSYFEAIAKAGLDRNKLTCIMQESPILEEQLTQAGLGFLPDFFALMRARVLLRANSSFSWWAAVLGDNERVFAPKLDGIAPVAGVCQVVPFVEGNWPAISCVHPNCSDLHLRET